MSITNDGVKDIYSENYNDVFFRQNTLKGIEAIRKRLLDLTTRNKLLNFRHTKKSTLRVVNKLPDAVFNQLMDNKLLILKPVPEPKFIDYDEKGKKPTAKEYAERLGISIDYDLPEPTEDNKLLFSHANKYLQTLHYPVELEAILRHISGIARTAIEESGTNMLYLAFGFLEWFEADYSEKKYLAPLLLVPVTITRNKKPNIHTGVFEYSIEYSGEDLSLNLSLSEKLKNDFGLDIPELDEGDTPEKYFSKCSGILNVKPQWGIKRHITLGLFYFGRLLMYLDLDPNSSAIINHTIIKDFFEGTKQEGYEEGEVYPIDAPDFVYPVPELIFDADSSQHSALIDAIRGKNLVIEGPPGTGKSQTITNLISAALVKGKTVLFISEKLAALEVVRRRLDEAGIGIFCLELHSHKTRKKELLKDLECRLERKGHFKNPIDLDNRINILKKFKKELMDYTGLVNQYYALLGMKVFEILWRQSRCRGSLNFDHGIVENIILRNAMNISFEDVKVTEADLGNYSTHLNSILSKITEISMHPWYGVTNTNIAFLDLKELIDKLTTLRFKINKLLDSLMELSDLVVLEIDNTPNFIKTVIKQKDELPSYKGDEIYTILPNLFNPRKIRIVEVFISKLLIYHNEMQEIQSYFNPIPMVDLQLIHNLREISEKSKYHDLFSSNVENIHTIIGEIRRISDLYEFSAKTFRELLKYIGCKLPYTNSNIQHVLSAIDLIKETPAKIYQLRQKSLEEEVASIYFDEAKHEWENLCDKRNLLNGKYDIKTRQEPKELREYASILDKAKFFTRLFSFEYRKAKQAHKALYRGGEKTNRLDMAKALGELADYFEQLYCFEENKRYQSLLGIHFNGLDTPFDDLSELVKWYATIRTILPGHHPGANILARALMDYNSEQILRIKDIDEKIIMVKELASLNREINVFVFKYNSLLRGRDGELDEIEDIDKIINSLDMLREESEKVIEALLDIYYQGDGSFNDAFVLINKLLELNITRKELNENKEVQNILGESFGGVETPIIKVETTLQLAEALRSSNLMAPLKLWLFDPKMPEREKEARQRLEEIGSLYDEFISIQSEFIKFGAVDWNLWLSNADIANQNLTILTDRIDRALNERQSLSEWLNFLRSKEELKQAGLEVLSHIAEQSKIKPHDLIPAYNYILFNSLAREIHAKYPSIMTKFNGLTLQEVRQKFIEYDLDIIELNRERAAYMIDSRDIPTGISMGPVGKWTNLPLIKHEIGKHKKHIPIRQLLSRAGEALQALKPCFMMGPLSVAQYLPPGRLNFDLVVMDEASQIKPEDALGAVARGSQVVIVGDPKQLPPTSFFDRVLEDEGENDDDHPVIHDVESILEIASLLYQPIRRLNWHYRSRHGSLIAFSNKEFYENKLTVFPSSIAESPNLGVKYHYISNGIYENRSNRHEAEFVVGKVIGHMRENPRESLGVVTLNIPQRELIERIFDDRIKNDPIAQNYLEARQMGAEPFFIKNLENVQGDERDVIFISVTYGRDRNGNLYHRFGPINAPNGGRRLNVLYTRAKKRTVIFSSMDADEIKCDTESSPGLRALKGYLAFAKSGILEQPAEEGRLPASDFEISVGNALKGHGLDIVPQVGVAGFYIDIAIRHPNRPGSYILGVECDGATYHSAKSIRDRDRLRQDILVNLGWNIHRIWSTDWFSNERKEIEKISARVSGILAEEQARVRPIAERITPTEERITPTEERITPTDREFIPPITREKLFYTIDEARKLLIDLRENLIKKELPDLDPEKGILRKAMLDILLKDLPINKKEWQACTTLTLREKTDIRQMKYIDKIFSVLENVI